MMKTVKDGFKLTTSADGIDRLLFNSSSAKNCINFVIKHNIKHIVLNPSHGFSDLDLRSITPLRDFLEGLIIGSKTIDLSALGVFHNLHLLGYPDNKKDRITLSNFHKLESLATDFSERLTELETCRKLKRLTLTNYRSKNGDLSDLPTLPSLQ